MNQYVLLSLAATLLPLSPAGAQDADAARQIGVETSLAFPNRATIRTFEADGDDGVWIEDRQRNWYYATVIGPCTHLSFAQALGVDTGGTSRLDKFGAILVGGDRCALSSFVTAEKPLPRKERLKRAEAARAADAAKEN